MYLESAFAETNFRFDFMKLQVVRNDPWHYCRDEAGFKKKLRRGTEGALNIYICDTLRFMGLVGSATFPIEVEKHMYWDGILLMNPGLDNVEIVKEVLLTLPHEVGHWLGLLHSFQDGCSPDYDCDGGSGDGVLDTAAHDGPSWNHNGWEMCHDGIRINTCDDNTEGVDPGLDPVLNYMNYIHEDCMDQRGEFTQGQKERMLAHYEEFRLNAQRRRLRRELGEAAWRHHDSWEPQHEAFLNHTMKRRSLQSMMNEEPGGRVGMQSTNDTHLLQVCMEKTLNECGCDMDCIARAADAMGRVVFDDEEDY